MNTPLCKCGYPVMVHESWHAAYDDGGSIDSFEVELHYDTECELCCEERLKDAEADRFINYQKDQADELPF